MIGKVRPQIFLALCILGTVAVLGIQHNLNEIAVGCIAGAHSPRSQGHDYTERYGARCHTTVAG